MPTRFWISLALLSAGCAPPEPVSTRMNTFGNDVAFLKEHTGVLLLQSGDAKIALAPEYQARVMTSTSGGADGPSYGWLNRDAIASGERRAHINVFGGEDRFWLGPEGGQFSIFFKAGEPFDLEHWQTPAPIDWGGWEAVEHDESFARFEKSIELVNYSSTKFTLDVSRTIRLLSEPAKRLGLPALEDVSVVAYESENRVTNTGEDAWQKETGLLSIWILGMFNPSPRTTVVIPFEEGADATHGPVVNDAYFGKVPADRLRIEPGVVFFRGDGEHRSKIGVNRARAKPVIGSYDADGKVLTLVHYSLEDGATDYVNSMWELQDEPYTGDVVNSYNDGPPEPGAPPLGPFYELETSSPGASLAPGEHLTHVHQTFHFQGREDALDAIARATLDVSLERITAAFAP